MLSPPCRVEANVGAEEGGRETETEPFSECVYALGVVWVVVLLGCGASGWCWECGGGGGGGGGEVYSTSTQVFIPFFYSSIYFSSRR